MKWAMGSRLAVLSDGRAPSLTQGGVHTHQITGFAEKGHQATTLCMLCQAVASFLMNCCQEGNDTSDRFQAGFERFLIDRHLRWNIVDQRVVTSL